MLFQPAQQQRTQPGREPFAGDALGGFGLFATYRRLRRSGFVGHRGARFVGFEKLFLVAQVAGLDEIHDAPQVQQPVLERRTRERQTVFRLDLLHRLRDLGARILNDLA